MYASYSISQFYILVNSLETNYDAMVYELFFLDSCPFMNRVIVIAIATFELSSPHVYEGFGW